MAIPFGTSEASIANLVLDDLGEQLYQALVAALWEGKAKGEVNVALSHEVPRVGDQEAAAEGHASWSGGRCEFTASVNGSRWTGHIGYRVGKSRHNTISRIDSWIWPDGPTMIRGTAFEFAVHPGEWTKLAASGGDFIGPFIFGLQGAIRANVGAESVTIWTPSILYVMAQLHGFVSDCRVHGVTVPPIDQEFPILLERGDGWAGMTITKTDGRHVLRTSRTSFEKAVARALGDLAVLVGLRAPAILERPGLAWLRSSRPDE